MDKNNLESTFEEYFNFFHKLNRQKRLSSESQSTYFAILYEFIDQQFPTEIELSINELQELAGLDDVSVAHEAKRILKNIGAIDFKTRNGRTFYKLSNEQLNKSSILHTPRIFPLNQVFYGVPGTGKTFSMTSYAVAICNNKNLDDNPNYDEIKQ